MERAIEDERARCLGLVEAYHDVFEGYASSLVTRLANIIRNGVVPEVFLEQMTSDEPTDYAEPTTVDQERQRCLDCIRMHFDPDTPAAVKEMLLDLELAILKGPS